MNHCGDVQGPNGPALWVLRGGKCPPRFLGSVLRSRMRLPRAILAKNGAALLAPFTFHDLRRSAVTHIAESLGICPRGASLVEAMRPAVLIVAGQALAVSPGSSCCWVTPMGA